MTMPTASIDPMESSGTAAAYTPPDRVAYVEPSRAEITKSAESRRLALP
jgi:hypothetical protein